jgi:PEP-CTERM motif
MVRVMVLFAALALVAGIPAFGGAISIDGSYHEFLFGGVGSTATTCGGGCTATTSPVAEQTSTSPWTFTGAANMFVLDLFISTDRFEVFDNAVSLGLTSAPTAGGACGGDIACAIADSKYSRASFILGGGSHSLTFVANLSPSGGGAAVFSVGSAVPEPATYGLIGMGLGLLAMIRRRRA